MEFWKTYMRSRAPELVRGAVAAGIFLASFYLYHLPLGAALYPCMLTAVLWLAWTSRDALKERKRARSLMQLSRNRNELLHGDLPEADTPMEAVYRETADALRNILAETIAQTDRQFEERREYYTLWMHQIKTPIASMRLQLQNEDSAASRRLRMELTRIEQYADMAMAYLRLDGGSTDYVFAECSLDDVIRTAVKRFSGDFIQRRLRLEYQPTEASVLTDAKWLGFVVEQVLSNALKYTPSGSIAIEWTEERCLCIRDTGIGIAPEDLPRVFESSYTGINGRRDRRASGIGLYLCKRICTRLGHDIAIESVPGEGTAVRIDLKKHDLEVR